MTDHIPLIARLESAGEGSRSLDADVALCVGWTVHPGDNWIGPFAEIAVPDYTTSLDAALALAERLCPRFTVTVVKYRTNDGEFKPSAEASLINPYGEITEHRGKAATPALALSAAILKALSTASEAR